MGRPKSQLRSIGLVVFLIGILLTGHSVWFSFREYDHYAQNSLNKDFVNVLQRNVDGSEARSKAQLLTRSSVVCEEMLRQFQASFKKQEETTTPRIVFDISSWLDSEDCGTRAHDLESMLRRHVIEKSCLEPIEPKEFVCGMGCDRMEPELEESLKLWKMRNVDFSRLWYYCNRGQVDALIWIHANQPKYYLCKPKIHGSRLWAAKRKLIRVLACTVKLPDVIYAFSNSDFVVPDETQSWLKPLPGIVRYVATPSHAAVLFPTGAYVEATTHLLIQLVDEESQYLKVQRDMDQPRRIKAVQTPWQTRKDYVWWRGSPTGSPNNKMSLEYLPRFTLVERFVNVSGFDVGFIGDRVSSSVGKSFKNLFNANKYEKVSPRHFCHHKFILHCDGNSAAWGLALKMTTATTILWIESLHQYREFYYTLLKPYFHYIPVTLDMSDLEEQRKCLIEEPTLNAYAQKVALNGRELFETRLKPAATYCYILRLFLSIAQYQQPATPERLENHDIPVADFTDFFEKPNS